MLFSEVFDLKPTSQTTGRIRFFCPLNTRLRPATARRARKDAKIQRTICRLIQTSFGVFGVFRGSDSLSPLFCSVGIFFDLNGQDGIVGPAAMGEKRGF
jgi:hypothetical protein